MCKFLNDKVINAIYQLSHFLNLNPIDKLWYVMYLCTRKPTSSTIDCQEAHCSNPDLGEIPQDTICHLIRSVPIQSSGGHTHYWLFSVMKFMHVEIAFNLPFFTLNFFVILISAHNWLTILVFHFYIILFWTNYIKSEDKWNVFYLLFCPVFLPSLYFFPIRVSILGSNPTISSFLCPVLLQPIHSSPSFLSPISSLSNCTMVALG